jgi:uncharacterized protein (DUF58 family)
MKWKVSSQQTGFLDLLAILSIFLSLFFLINGTFQFGFIILFFFIYYFASKFYFKHVTDFLELKNEKQKIKIYPNDQAKVTLDITQLGVLPIVNGVLEFDLEANVETSLHTFDKQRDSLRYKVPLQLLRGKKQIVTFDVIAKHRGVARLKDVTLHVPNILGIGNTTYYFNEAFFTEIIVVPTIEKVSGVEKIQSANQGATPIRSSLYEDLTMQVGTRQYAQGDPFNRINWKASARTTELQTKVYEKTTDVSWTILLNVMEFKTTYSINVMEELETAISQVAYMAQVATHLKIPYSVAINFGTNGDKLFLSQEKGEGKDHFAKTMELLAYIHAGQAPIPMIFVAKNVGRLTTSMPIAILIGEVEGKESEEYMKWVKKGTSIHVLKDGALRKNFLSPLKARGENK